MKSIVWIDTIYILKEGTAITVDDGGVIIELDLISDELDIALHFSGDPNVRVRMEKDPAFKAALPKIVQWVLIKFLSDDKMSVLDLASTLIGVKMDAALPVAPDIEKKIKKGEASAER